MGRKNPKNMTIEELRAEVDAGIREALLKQLDNVDALAQRYVSEATLSVISSTLGYKKDYHGKWVLQADYDDTNAFLGTIRKVVKENLGEQFSSDVSAVIAEFDMGDPAIKTKYRKAYKEELGRILREDLREHAARQARTDATRVMDAYAAEFGRPSGWDRGRNLGHAFPEIDDEE